MNMLGLPTKMMWFRANNENESLVMMELRNKEVQLTWGQQSVQHQPLNGNDM